MQVDENFFSLFQMYVEGAINGDPVDRQTVACFFDELRTADASTIALEALFASMTKVNA